MNRHLVHTNDVVAAMRDLANAANLMAETMLVSQATALDAAEATRARALWESVELCQSFAEETLVKHMRDAGASWQVVGAVLNTSRQAVHERYAYTDRDSVPE